MRLTFLLISLAVLMLLSCTQNVAEQIPMSLKGTWKMIKVKDNVTGTAMSKPSSIQGDVLITFTPHNTTEGIFTGKTPTNDIWTNNYSIGPNKTITIPVLAMTKVAETSWGEQFVNNIRQSKTYDLETDRKLIIITTNTTITFSKL